MTQGTDITDQVEYESFDNEALALTRCVCGLEYRAWGLILSAYPDELVTCSNCGRKMYFSVEVKVLEVRGQ